MFNIKTSLCITCRYYRCIYCYSRYRCCRYCSKNYSCIVCKYDCVRAWLCQYILTYNVYRSNDFRFRPWLVSCSANCCVSLLSLPMLSEKHPFRTEIMWKTTWRSNAFEPSSDPQSRGSFSSGDVRLEIGRITFSFYLTRGAPACGM